MKKIVFLLSIFVFVLSINLNSSYSVPRNLLVEYVTGTWCGYCPCGHRNLESIELAYPQTIAIAYHTTSPDPWRFFNGYEIRALLGYTAAPSAIFDRTNAPVGFASWYSLAVNRYNSSPNSNVDILITSKTFDSPTRTLNFTVNSTASTNLTGQYNINFVIVENRLIYPQNYYSTCGTPGYVNDYSHMHVARTVINRPAGDELNTQGTWAANETIARNVSTVLDPAWAPENCKIIIFVFKGESVLNLSTVEQAVQTDVGATTGINANSAEIPDSYSLSQNYPNPFNPTTSIKFSIPKDGNVSFKIYDLNGKEVADYFNGFLQKGTYNVEFDGSNLSSGIYFYALTAGDFADKKKMIMIK